MKNKKNKNKLKRDGNILFHIKGLINLSNRIVKSKKVYSRKNTKLKDN